MAKPTRIGGYAWYMIPQDRHVSFQERKVAICRPFASCL
jgi:hypothetical protein